MALELFAILALLLVSPTLADSDVPIDPAICDAFHQQWGGEELPWLGYENGGWNLPADLMGDGGFNFPADGGVSFYRSPSQPDSEWVFVFLSYEAMTDANGEHLGQHALCGPYRIARETLKPLLQAHPSALGYVK